MVKYQWPTKDHRITSGWGPRNAPTKGASTLHNAIDIASVLGAPVLPIAPGIIEFLGNMGGYGKTVKIKHDDGKVSRYSHLKEISPNLKPGQRVDFNTLLGGAGMSGITTGTHLDLGTYENNKPINPLTLLGTEIPGGNQVNPLEQLLQPQTMNFSSLQTPNVYMQPDPAIPMEQAKLKFQMGQQVAPSMMTPELLQGLMQLVQGNQLSPMNSKTFADTISSAGNRIGDIITNKANMKGMGNLLTQYGQQNYSERLAKYNQMKQAAGQYNTDLDKIQQTDTEYKTNVAQQQLTQKKQEGMAIAQALKSQNINVIAPENLAALPDDFRKELFKKAMSKDYQGMLINLAKFQETQKHNAVTEKQGQERIGIAQGNLEVAQAKNKREADLQELKKEKITSDISKNVEIIKRHQKAGLIDRARVLATAISEAKAKYGLQSTETFSGKGINKTSGLTSDGVAYVQSIMDKYDKQQEPNNTSSGNGDLVF